MTPERIAELLNYVGIQLTDFRDGELADLLATAEREARLREALLDIAAPDMWREDDDGNLCWLGRDTPLDIAVAALEQKGGES